MNWLNPHLSRRGTSQESEIAIKGTFEEENQTSIEECQKLEEWANGKSKVLELGTYRCGTTSYLSRVVGQVVSVDNYLEGTIEDYARNIVKLKGFNINNVQLINSSTESFLLSTREMFDLIFIDACHQFKSVVRDIILSEYRLRYCGIICGHDYDMDGVKRAVDELVVPYYRSFEVYKHLWKGESLK